MESHACINGITGHAENATAPYGDYSARIWKLDGTKLRPALAQILDLQVRFGLPLHALRFYFPALWPEAEADVAS